MDGELLSVGQIVPELRTNGTFIMLNYGEPVWEYTVGYPHITEQEIHEFQYGSIVATATTVNGVLFFLLKAGELNWADAAYEPRLASSKPSFATFKDGEGAPLLIKIADTATGEIKVFRLMGLGTQLSNYLSKTCTALLHSKTKFNRTEYRNKIQAVYRKYPISDDLVKVAGVNNIFVLVKPKEDDNQ